jgi:adenosine kinase
MRREYGGCAGNIAYNLNLLGEEALAMAVVGHDFEPYSQWMSQNGLSSEFIFSMDNQYTGQAYITTDEDGNQITAFHPGAMNFSHENRVSQAEGVKLGIVAPDGRQGMQQHAREFHAAGVPFVFDPGQGMPMFSGADLERFIEQADYVTVNDYEAKLLQEKTGRKLDDIAKSVRALIVTLGADGSLIYANGKQIAIPTPKPEAVIDPTGCGDAYRAGLLYGMQRDWDWETSGRLASMMGSLKIASRGGQNHKPMRQELMDLFHKHFGHRIIL